MASCFFSCRPMCSEKLQSIITLAFSGSANALNTLSFSSFLFYLSLLKNSYLCSLSSSIPNSLSFSMFFSCLRERIYFLLSLLFAFLKAILFSLIYAFFSVLVNFYFFSFISSVSSGFSSISFVMFLIFEINVKIIIVETQN